MINYPLLNTAQEEKTLDKRFIAKLTFLILSYVAEKEREEITNRQAMRKLDLKSNTYYAFVKELTPEKP